MGYKHTIISLVFVLLFKCTIYSQYVGSGYKMLYNVEVIFKDKIGYIPYYDVSVKDDEFEGLACAILEGNYVEQEAEAKNDIINKYWGLNVSIHAINNYKENKKTYDLQINIICVGNVDHPNIKSGKSLLLLIDGNKDTLTTDLPGLLGILSNKNRVKIDDENESHLEMASYAITPQLLKKIALAKSVKLKILGQNTDVYTSFNMININNIHRFYNDFCINWRKVT